MTDITPSFPLDEPVTINSDVLAKAFSQVDRVIKNALEQQDPEIAAAGLSQLTGMERVAGLAKAKLLFRLQESWKKFDLPGEDFKDFLMERSAISRETIDRYILVWKIYESGSVPKALVPKLMGRTMRDQIKIAVIADRIPLKEKEWKAISNTVNEHELTELKHKLLNQAPRKSGITIRLRKNGDLEATDNRRKPFLIGYMKYQEKGSDPIIDKAIERIVRAAGILEE